MNRQKTVVVSKFWALVLLLSLLVAGCGSADTPTPETIPVTVESAPATTGNNTGQNGAGQNLETAAVPDYPAPSGDYPEAPAAGVPDYPGANSEAAGAPDPPNPERDIPVPDSTTGAVGGVLVHQMDENSFEPVVPRALYLGEVLLNSTGEQALISQGTDSPQAQLFQTGVFIFSDVPPGTYGLIIDLGFAQFPLTDESGLEMLIDVEGGQAYDLGQIMVRLSEP